jgi:hypothetical protein
VSITRPHSTAPPLAHGRRRPASRGRRAQWGRAPWRRLHTALSARWHGAELDGQLAAGERPWVSDALAARARQITTGRSRRQLAAGLAGVLRSARARGPAWTAAARPNVPDVVEARAVLATLDRRLRAPEPVAAQGVAMVRALLVDGNGLLYRPREPGALGSYLRAAAAALEPPKLAG